jgi:hypothetical protein
MSKADKPTPTPVLVDDTLAEALATLLTAIGPDRFSHNEWDDVREGLGLLVAAQRRIRKLERQVKQLETEQRALNAAPKLRAVNE